MHIIVPTSELLDLITKIKAIKTMKTSGYEFPVYTLKAVGDKLKFITSDRLSTVASKEIFAKVLREGTVSVNGSDFYRTISQFRPYSTTKGHGSFDVELNSTDTELNISAELHYEDSSKVVQKRQLSLVDVDLSNMDMARFDMEPINFKVENFTKTLLYLYKIVSYYSNDDSGLQGILLRIKDGMLKFVVSDSVRLLEVSTEIDTEAEIDLILPKLSCSLLSSLIEEGDRITLSYTTHQAKFEIENEGLTTKFITSLIMGVFPSYEQFFTDEHYYFMMNKNILADNLSTLRRLGDKAAYINFEFKQKTLKLHSSDSTHYKYTNEGIPVKEMNMYQQNFRINAILLPPLVDPVLSENIRGTVDAQKKMLRLYSIDEVPSIRGVIRIKKEG